MPAEAGSAAATPGGSASGLLRELAAEAQPGNLAAAAAAAMVVALSAIVSGIGVAALVFTGPLQPFLFSGIGVVLFGAVMMLATLSLTSSYPGSLCLPQEVPAVILGLLATSLYGELSASMSPQQALPLVMFAIALSTALTGLAFLLLGTLRLGGFIRFIPFPMVGGVLAGLGWLLVQGGVTVLLGEPMSLAEPGLLVAADHPLRLASGLLVGLALLAATARFDHFSVVPVVLGLAIAAFYALLALAGKDAAFAQQTAWLLGPFPEGRVWAPIAADTLARFDWSLLLTHLPIIGTLVLASTVSILMYASGLELGVRRDMDLNHELRSCGLANLLAALGGGVPGFHSMGDSLLARAMGAPFRLTGLLAAALVAVGLFAGFGLLAWFPRPVLAGLLLFLGFSLLHEWVIRGFRRLPRGDWLVVMLILGVSGYFGFLAGIGVGIVAGIILFTVTYSRLDTIRHELDAASFHSNVERPPHQLQRLRERGASVQVLILQGFVFFGTANKVLGRVVARLGEAPPLSHVLLDFSRVSGLDSSSITTFRKLDQQAESHGLVLVFTGLSADKRAILAASELALEDNPRILLEDDIDHGLELCERHLLKGMTDVPQGSSPATLPSSLDGLERYARPCAFRQGETLIRQGENSDDMYWIVEGRVSVRLDGMEARQRRLRSYGPGSLVGEMAFYLGGKRSASVVADTDTRAFCLSGADITRMSTEDPAAAARFHAALAAMLAQRLFRTNSLLQQFS